MEKPIFFKESDVRLLKLEQLHNGATVSIKKPTDVICTNCPIGNRDCGNKAGFVFVVENPPDEDKVIYAAERCIKKIPDLHSINIIDGYTLKTESELGADNGKKVTAWEKKSKRRRDKIINPEKSKTTGVGYRRFSDLNRRRADKTTWDF